MAGRRRGRGVPPAASRPRRPGRPAQVRIQRRAKRAGARQRARDGRPGRRRRDREGVPARRSASASTATCCGSPRCEAPAPDDLGPEDFAEVDDSPVRCLDSEAERGDGRRDRPPPQGEREPRRHVRGAGVRAAPGLGSHVSWEERLDSRLAQAIVSIQAVKGVSVGEAWDVAGCPAPSRTTRSSSRRNAAGIARRTAPAASRAG